MTPSAKTPRRHSPRWSADRLTSTLASLATAVVFLVLSSDRLSAVEPEFETVRLPALRVDGQVATAHTQGLELVAGRYLVTARREDVRPHRALLLRTAPGRTDWDAWDITPLDEAGTVTALDHPGGMQSDGQRLWIPLAESKRKGRSLIRAYPLSGLVVGRPLQAELEFPVDDHIGAVAVSTGRRLVFGANWDTETVYVWDLQGRLQRTLTSPDLKRRGIGVDTGATNRTGVTVQDWKVVGDRLFVSGLFRAPGSTAVRPESRLLSFSRFLGPDFQQWSAVLPLQQETELAQEAMAIADGIVHFLPEDLGATNRVFRVPLSDLMKGGSRP